MLIVEQTRTTVVYTTVEDNGACRTISSEWTSRATLTVTNSDFTHREQQTRYRRSVTSRLYSQRNLPVTLMSPRQTNFCRRKYTQTARFCVGLVLFLALWCLLLCEKMSFQLSRECVQCTSHCCRRRQAVPNCKPIERIVTTINDTLSCCVWWIGIIKRRELWYKVIKGSWKKIDSTSTREVHEGRTNCTPQYNYKGGNSEAFGYDITLQTRVKKWRKGLALELY